MPQTSARQPLQARARRTREALLEAGAAEFGDKGYAATTTKSIAARAGVAVGSFYQYFANKDLVLHELAEARYRHVETKAFEALPPVEGPQDAPRTRAALSAIVQLVLDLHRADPGLHAVLSERRHADPELDRRTDDFETRLVARIEGWLAAWSTPGDRGALAFTVFGLLEGSVHAHVLGRAHVPDARLRAGLVEALVRIARPDLAAAE